MFYDSCFCRITPCSAHCTANNFISHQISREFHFPCHQAKSTIRKHCKMYSVRTPGLSPQSNSSTTYLVSNQQQLSCLLLLWWLQASNRRHLHTKGRETSQKQAWTEEQTGQKSCHLANRTCPLSKCPTQPYTRCFVRFRLATLSNAASSRKRSEGTSYSEAVKIWFTKTYLHNWHSVNLGHKQIKIKVKRPHRLSLDITSGTLAHIASTSGQLCLHAETG